jgi:predicted dehydrogenase
MQPVRWGILSTARIGRMKVVPGMMKSPLCEISAVASRDQKTAQSMASEIGIPKAYGSYEALLADAGVKPEFR